MPLSLGNEQNNDQFIFIASNQTEYKTGERVRIINANIREEEYDRTKRIIIKESRISEIYYLQN